MGALPRHEAPLRFCRRLRHRPCAPAVAKRIDDGVRLLNLLRAGLIREAQAAGVVALRALPILDVAVIRAGCGLRIDVHEAVHVIRLGNRAVLDLGCIVGAHALLGTP